MARSLSEKLGLTSQGKRFAVVAAPSGLIEGLGLPDHADPGTDDPSAEVDVVLAFVERRDAVEASVAAALARLRPGGSLWMVYPKRSGTIRTDLSRDVGWEALQGRDWLPVAQIALDATWSALRFRPRVEIRKLTRKP